MSGLFEEEDKKSSASKVFMAVGGIVLLVIGAIVYFTYPVKPKRPTGDEARYSDENIRNAMAMMLAQPRFSGDKFREHLLGKANLEMYNVKAKEMYFSLPKMSEEELNTSLAKFTGDRAKVEFAQLLAEKLRVGEYNISQSDEQYYFFKIPLENLKIDKEAMLDFEFEKAKYSISVKEIYDFIDNKQIYGGMMTADTALEKDGMILVFANHGTFVAKPNEPSLQRFINELFKDLPPDTSREAKIQRLLDFVTKEIKYDFNEALSDSETLKRPNETLFVKSADCSNKTILMASLLEQIGEDYILLYCPKHITVAIPKGGFPNENKLDYKWEEKDWVIAETTNPGFQIGKTKLQDSILLSKVEYVQRPKLADIIFDADTFRPLDFR